MLEVKNLKKEFQSGDSILSALQDVSFTIPEGMFAAIIGKSGSGKSTLLALLGALDRPSQGTVKGSGVEITRLGDRKLTKYRRDSIGFVFQQYNLVPNL